MAKDAYIKFDGIEGECRDKQHEGWCEFNSSGLQLHSGAAESKDDPRPHFEEVEVEKEVDLASHRLYHCCADQERVIPKVTIELCRASGKKVPFLKLVFEEVYITDCELSLDADDSLPTETITFKFHKVHINYQPVSKQSGEATGSEQVADELENYAAETGGGGDDNQASPAKTPPPYDPAKDKMLGSLPGMRLTDDGQFRRLL